MKNRADKVDTLESSIVADVEKATKEVKKLQLGLGDTGTEITKTKEKSNNFAKEFVDNVTNKMKNGMEKVNKEVDKTAGYMGNLSSAASAFKTALGLGVVVKGVQAMYRIVSSTADEYGELVTSTQMFKATMGELVNIYDNNSMENYYEKALKFQDEMNQKLLINTAELRKNQSMFYGLFSSQGVNEKDSYKMSESLSKAGYDISQLYYGGDTNAAMNALKSGIAGQVESLRTIGIDVSESSLNGILARMGIDRTVTQLSYAEKEILRYNAIMEQASRAQGAFAKNLESPIQMLTQFKAQFMELKQVIGSVVMNAFGGVIQYLTGVMMAIKNIIKDIAGIFGVEIGSTRIDVSEQIGTSNLAGDIDNATASAKKFQLQLMGFDEINNITEPSSSGSSSGLSGYSGVDPKILNSLKEWDNQMAGISSKSEEIAKNIKKWYDEKLRKHIEWIRDNFDTVKNVIKAIGIALLAWKISNGVMSFLNMFLGKNWNMTQLSTGLLFSITGIMFGYNGTKKLLNGDISIGNLMESLLGTAGGAFGIVTLMKSLGKTIKFGDALKIALGVELVFSSITSNWENGKEDGGVWESFKNIAAGTLGGAVIAGPIGGLIGGVATIVGDIAGRLSFIKEQVEIIEESQEVFDENSEGMKKIRKELSSLSNSYKDNTKQIKENYESNLLSLELAKTNVEVLGNLVDENGKVVGAYGVVDIALKELSDTLGISLERDEDKISLNGQVMKSYDELKNSIENVITAKKEELQQRVNEELYLEALTKKTEAEKKLNEYILERMQVQAKLQKLYEEGYTSNDKEFKDTMQRIQELNIAIEDSTRLASESIKDTSYYGMQMGLQVGDNIKKNSDMVVSAMVSLVQEGKNEWQKAYDELELDQQKSFLIQASQIQGATPELQAKWQELKERSIDEYKNALSELPDETIGQIADTETKINIVKERFGGVFANLGKKATEKFDLSEMNDKTEIAINSVETKLTMDEKIRMAVIGLRNNMLGVFDDNSEFEEIGVNIPKGIQKGTTREMNKPSFINTFRNLANIIPTTIKKLLNIQSPSRVMMNLAQYIPQGLAIGIEKDSYRVYNSMSKLGEGIEAEAENFGIGKDMNLVGNIAKEVNISSKINIGNQIVDQISTAVRTAIERADLSVNIEAKTEEGIIVKKATEGINEYIQRTGELPFPVPI